MSPSAPAGKAQQNGNADAVWVSATYISPCVERYHQPGRADASDECANVGKDVGDQQITDACPRRGRHTAVVPAGALLAMDGMASLPLDKHLRAVFQIRARCKNRSIQGQFAKSISYMKAVSPSFGMLIPEKRGPALPHKW